MRSSSNVSKLKDNSSRESLEEKRGNNLKQNVHQRTKQQPTTSDVRFAPTTRVRDAFKRASRASPPADYIYQCLDVVEIPAKKECDRIEMSFEQKVGRKGFQR